MTYVALSNSWIIINVGGGPTDDKPAVTLETPRDPDGHLIEAGQATDPQGDWSPVHWPSTTDVEDSDRVWADSRKVKQTVVACSSGTWRAPAQVMNTVGMSTPQPQHGRWPDHLPVGALRVVRWSARYDETVIFYRDAIGLPVLETFQDSYGLDGTILGLPGGPVHLEIVRMGNGQHPASGLDQLVFYLPDVAARDRMTGRLAAAGVHPVAQIDYWEDHGGVTYQDPDGREVVFASWIYGPPAS